MKTKYVLLVIRSLLIGVFIYAGLIKVYDYAAFQMQLEQAPYIESISVLVGMLFLGSCFLIGGLSLFEKTMRYGMVLAFYFLLVLSVYLGIVLRFSSHVPCTCIGLFPQLSWISQLVSSVVLLAVVGVGLGLGRRTF